MEVAHHIQMINSRNIEDLDPAAREVCYRHLALCNALKIELIVTSTWRDFEAQDALYQIGRTVQVTRRPVTQARSGRSWHNYKCAWDVVPIVLGKAVWNAFDPLWSDVVRLGKDAGASAGADWNLFPDMPHFQVVPRMNERAISIEIALERLKTHGTVFTEEA